MSTCNEQGLDNALKVGGVITFACNGIITNHTTKVITNQVVLDATGRSVTLHGGDQIRLFTVSPGASLTLLEINLAGGAHLAEDGADGTSGSTRGRSGSPGMGGAVFNDGGTVRIENCNFHDNRADGGYGGNGYNANVCEDPGTGGPAGAGLGGAVYQKSGTLIVLNSSFYTNSVAGGPGGLGGAGGSCFSGVSGKNGALGGHARGGAIYIESGTAGITNCTFQGNYNLGGAGGDGGNGSGALGRGGDGGDGGNSEGAAVYVQGGTVLLVNLTLGAGSLTRGNRGKRGLASNSNLYGSYGDPGVAHGACLAIGAGAATIANSILAGESTVGNCFGTLVDGGYNLSSDESCGFTDHGLNNVNPMLLVLTNNGGTTLTRALGAESPAIDAANPDVAPTTDQRKLNRSGLPDIGAYEHSGEAVTVKFGAVTASVTESGNSNGVFVVSRTGALAMPLTVNLWFGGDAVRDSDYTLVGISGIQFALEIPAGSSSTTLELAIVPDTDLELHERVEARILPGNYLVGDPSSATIAIIDDDLVGAELTILERTVDSGFGFSFDTSTAGSYAVEYSDNLNLTNWVVLTNFIGSGSLWEIQDPASVTVPQRYYRIKTQRRAN